MKRDADMKLDPLEWAKRLRSQVALDYLLRGAEYDHRLLDILTDHMESGVCDGTGKNLLRRWDGLQWVAA